MSEVKNLIEDISRLATNTASVAFESSKDIGEKFKGQIQNVLKGMDIVTREEFDVVRELCEKQALEIIELKEQINKPSKGAKSKEQTATKETKASKK